MAEIGGDRGTFGERAKGRGQTRKAGEKGKGGIIHVDTRETEKNKVIKATHFVHADCKVFLEAMNKIVEFKKREVWLKKMRSLKDEFHMPIPVLTEGRLSQQQVLQSLDRNLGPLKERCIFTTGVGNHQVIAAQQITWTKPRTILTSGSLGTMGVSTGFAIGAKLAAPDKVVISIDGDGSFNMTCGELKTIRETRIPVKILLLNNNSEMMVAYSQKLLYGGRYMAVDNNNCDYNKLCDAYGIKNLYCEHEKELEESIRAFLAFEGPILLHVYVEKTAPLPLVAPGQPLQNVVMKSDQDFTDHCLSYKNDDYHIPIEEENNISKLLYRLWRRR